MTRPDPPPNEWTPVVGSESQEVSNGAMLPDPWQFVHTLYPHEPLASLQRFNRWMHTKRRLHWPIGVSSQVAFVAAVVGTTFAIF